MSKQAAVVAFWNETALPFDKFQQLAKAAETVCRSFLWRPDTVKQIGDCWCAEIQTSAKCSKITKMVVLKNWQDPENAGLISRWCHAVEGILLHSEREEQEKEIYAYLLRHMRGQVRCSYLIQADNAGCDDVPECVLKDSLWEMVAEQSNLK